MVEYYGLTDASEDTIAIVLQNELIDTTAKMMEGNIYLELEDVQSLLNSRFYYDRNESLLIYTTPTQKIISDIGTSVYRVDGEEKSVD